MRRCQFPWFVLSVAVVILIVAALRPALADTPTGATAPNEPSGFPSVKVQPSSGGTVVQGKLRQSVVTVKTQTGTSIVLLTHVKRITFQRDPDGSAHDTVMLTDKTVVRGRVIDELFVVEIPGGEARLKKAEVREITVVSDVAVPLMAVLLGLLTLTAMEIVLGVDNIIFLAIIASRLPKEQQPKARKIGLAAALGTRLLLLSSIWLLLGLTAPLFTLPSAGFLHDTEAREVSLRDLVLLIGGLFLIAKSTYEIHKKVEESRAKPPSASDRPSSRPASFGWTIVTIAIIDIVFSLDSVITAVGMVEQIWVMIVAMIIAMAVMLYFAGPIAEFVDRHPTVKVLALSFLILIGVMLVAEGLGQHLDKGYIYLAMGFSLVVELVNMQLRRPGKSGEDPRPVEPQPR